MVRQPIGKAAAPLDLDEMIRFEKYKVEAWFPAINRWNDAVDALQAAIKKGRNRRKNAAYKYTDTYAVEHLCKVVLEAVEALRVVERKGYSGWVKDQEAKA